MSYPHYTNCAFPGQSYSWDIAGTTLGKLIVNVFFFGFMSAVTITIGLSSLACGIGAGALITLSVTAYQFKYWYYNKRLMCIDKKRCMIGTMVGNSHVSFDGDSKFDMLVAPFTVPEIHQFIIEELIADTGTFGTGPGGIGYDISNISAVHNYIEAFMSEKVRIELYSRVVHNRMFTGDMDRDYLKHYLIKDVVEMGQNAFDHADPDEYPPIPPNNSVNPMYRSTHTPTGFFDGVTGGSDLSESLLPFFHCELEGNYMATLLDNIAFSLLLLAGALTAACIGGPWGWIVAAIILLIIFLIWVFNDGDGDNSTPEDSGLDQGNADREAVVLEGDVLVIYGDWIMDEEHTQYFELHPIRAVHFILKRDTAYNVTQELYEGAESFDVSNILADDWKTICGIVSASEETDTVVNRTVNNSKAFSMMAGFA